MSDSPNLWKNSSHTATTSGGLTKEFIRRNWIGSRFSFEDISPLPSLEDSSQSVPPIIFRPIELSSEDIFSVFSLDVTCASTRITSGVRPPQARSEEVSPEGTNRVLRVFRETSSEGSSRAVTPFGGLRRAEATPALVGDLPHGTPSDSMSRDQARSPTTLASSSDRSSLSSIFSGRGSPESASVPKSLTPVHGHQTRSATATKLARSAPGPSDHGITKKRRRVEDTAAQPTVHSELPNTLRLISYLKDAIGARAQNEIIWMARRYTDRMKAMGDYSQYDKSFNDCLVDVTKSLNLWLKTFTKLKISKNGPKRGHVGGRTALRLRGSVPENEIIVSGSSGIIYQLLIWQGDLERGLKSFAEELEGYVKASTGEIETPINIGSHSDITSILRYLYRLIKKFLKEVFMTTYHDAHYKTGRIPTIDGPYYPICRDPGPPFSFLLYPEPVPDQPLDEDNPGKTEDDAACPATEED